MTVPEEVASPLTAERPQQLQMIWPRHRLAERPVWTLPAGYGLRSWRDGDAEAYVALMQRAGFATWGPDKLAAALERCLPLSLFFVVHQLTGLFVASASAHHHPTEMHPFGGELSWVAADPAHRGKGLGQVVCAISTCRLLDLGYENIYLRTDDLRLPAIRVYLKLGWVPLLFAPDMPGRWQAICRQLQWPYPAEMARDGGEVRRDER
jgi:mycothiol synthase